MNSSDDLTPNNNKTHLWVWFWLKTTRAKPWLARAYSRLWISDHNWVTINCYHTFIV